jgi:hypothetical protein
MTEIPAALRRLREEHQEFGLSRLHSKTLFQKIKERNGHLKG